MITAKDCTEAIDRLNDEERRLSEDLRASAPVHSDALSAQRVIDDDVTAAEARSKFDKATLAALRTAQMDCRCQSDELTRLQRERVERLETIDDERASWNQRLINTQRPIGQGV